MTSRLNGSCVGIIKSKNFCTGSTILIIKDPQNVLVDSLSGFYFLTMPSQITEGKTLIEPGIVSVKEDEEEEFLADCELWNH